MLPRAAAALVILLAVSPAFAQGPASTGITVVEPWARATPPGAKVGAAYLQLQAAPGSGDRLVAASSPVAGVAEIHAHIMDGDIARMRRIDAIPVPAGGSVTLKPGGFHIMLMDLTGPLKAGEAIKLKLRFEKAGEIEVEARVRPIGARDAGAGSGSGAGHGAASGAGSGSGAAGHGK